MGIDCGRRDKVMESIFSDAGHRTLMGRYRCSHAQYIISRPRTRYKVHAGEPSPFGRESADFGQILRSGAQQRLVACGVISFLLGIYVNIVLCNLYLKLRSLAVFFRRILRLGL